MPLPIHHIAIISSNRERALQFYADALGFRVIRETRRERDIKIDLQGAGYELELFIRADAPQRATYPEAYGLRHLAFHVRSVEAAVRALAEKGILCEDIRTDEITNRKMTFFHDPDGLPLELHE